MKLKISFAVICSLLLLFSCSSKNIDPVTGKETSYEIDPQKRAKEYARQGGGLFGDINNKKSSGTTYDFATSNVLWRATLKSLDFLPLINADYSGGIIVYDWYSEKEDQ